MSDPKLNAPSSSEMQIDNLQSNDFSLLELFFKADAVVMLVMLSLIFLSIWCWAIIFNKYFKFNYNYFLNFDFGIDNIFDIHYRTYSSGISAPGRNIRLGFNLKF